MPGFKVCVSTLYDVHTPTEPDAFLRTYPVIKQCMTVCWV